MPKELIVRLFFLLLSIHSKEIKACECAVTTDRFIDGLKKYEFIGLVEVIGVDTASDKDYEEDFTIVKVISLYLGDRQLDTIMIPNGDSSTCHVQITGGVIGNRFILKGFLGYRKQYEGYWSDLKAPEVETIDNPKVLVLSLCDQNTMVVNNDIVRGHFTTNKIIKKVSKDKYGGIEKYWYEDIYQTFTLKKIERRISRIMRVKKSPVK